MTHVQVTIEVDDEYDDPEHDTGMTEEGFEALSEAVNSVGVITDGPRKVQR